MLVDKLEKQIRTKVPSLFAPGADRANCLSKDGLKTCFIEMLALNPFVARPRDSVPLIWVIEVVADFLCQVSVVAIGDQFFSDAEVFRMPCR